MKKQPVFKKALFSGFDKTSVLDYIYELGEATQEAEQKLNAQMEELAAAREKLSDQLREMEAKLESSDQARLSTQEELIGERHRTDELSQLIDSLNNEILESRRIVAEKNEEIAVHLSHNQDLIDKNSKLEEKKEEVERASAYIGELMVRTRFDSEKIMADAARQAEELVADASASLMGVYEEFRRFRTDMDQIQDQIHNALGLFQEKFSSMNQSVEDTEYALRDFCRHPKTELKLVTEADEQKNDPIAEDSSVHFFRPAAEA